jgi:serine phosphatase RsbU (regulator of sigma subunit)/Tfp pilus assembly protein PilF
MHRILFFFFVLSSHLLVARIDSLKSSLSQSMHDTTRARTYMRIASEYYNAEGQLDSSFAYYDKALVLYQKLYLPVKQAKALNGKALIYREKGIYRAALGFALDALSLAENNRDTAQITSSLNNIAIINQIQKDYDKAYEYYKKCEAIHLKKKSTEGLASIYNNLGLLFSERRQPDRSLDYFSKSLRLNEENKNDRGIATNCENIGLHYLEYDKDPEKALHNFARSIGIWRGMKDKNSVAITLDYIVSALLVQKKYEQAIDSALLSLKLAKEAGSLYSERQAHEKLYQIYENTKNVDASFAHYKQFIALRDSLKNDDQLREITQMQMTYEFDKQREVMEIRKAAEQNELADKIGKQKLVIYACLIVLVIGSVFSFLVWRSYRNNRIANKKIAFQKGLLEEQNKNIVDSIKYARHIQEAILPPKAMMLKYLPEHFVFYKPKDIVSGDFFWLKEKNDKIYFAVVDCTGHGVPGAFMSIVGANGLNEALNNLADPTTGELLDFLNSYVNDTLNQTIESSTVRDGMDLSVIKIDRKKSSLQYSGANNPLWIVNPARRTWPENSHFFNSSTEGAEISPDKQAIGNFVGYVAAPFKSHTVDLQKGDVLYMLTDGFADQFGGEKGKKFKYKKLQQHLLAIHKLPMPEQKESLTRVFNDWKGSLEQVDDVCIIGIGIS